MAGTEVGHASCRTSCSSVQVVSQPAVGVTISSSGTAVALSDAGIMHGRDERSTGHHQRPHFSISLLSILRAIRIHDSREELLTISPCTGSRVKEPCSS